MLRKEREYPVVRDVTFLNSCGSLTFDSWVVDSVDLYNWMLYNLEQNMQQAEEALRRWASSGERCVLLLEGGSDINPKIYGEENYFSAPGLTRDAFEIPLYALAEELNIPIFGICRGHQLIAALNGGTLYQDIGRDLGVRHGGGWIDTFGIMSEWYPKGRDVNSAHHQAVKVVPENATVIARDHAHPEIIEALCYDRMISVQWHPEFVSDIELVQHVVDYLFR
jgi:gamma-glutamyl-gamma-aminobutyrate hydrolase PuuD